MIFLDYYAVLNDSDSGDLFGIMNFANTVSGNIFMPVMLLSIWAIWLIGGVTIGKPIWRTWTMASFIVSILGILMAVMNWLSPNWLYACFLMLGIGVIATKLSESYS
jgi:hypothetical protein